MAQEEALRFSPGQADPAHTEQGQRGEGHSHSGGANEPVSRWLAELSALAIDGPRRLPSWRDALSQASSIRALPTIAGHPLGA